MNSVRDVILRGTDDPAGPRKRDGVREILLVNDAEIMEPAKQFAQTGETGVLDIVQHHNAPILFRGSRDAALDPSVRVPPVFRHIVPDQRPEILRKQIIEGGLAQQMRSETTGFAVGSKQFIRMGEFSDAPLRAVDLLDGVSRLYPVAQRN